MNPIKFEKSNHDIVQRVYRKLRNAVQEMLTISFENFVFYFSFTRFIYEQKVQIQNFNEIMENLIAGFDIPEEITYIFDVSQKDIYKVNILNLFMILFILFFF